MILCSKTNLKHINKAHVVQLGAPKESADQLGAVAATTRCGLQPAAVQYI